MISGISIRTELLRIKYRDVGYGMVRRVDPIFAATDAGDISRQRARSIHLVGATLPRVAAILNGMLHAGP